MSASEESDVALTLVIPLRAKAEMSLADFYQEMGISGLYKPAERIVLITAKPAIRRPTVRVGGCDTNLWHTHG